MDPITKSASLPPRKGLTKVQQGFTTQNVPNDNCPSAAICQKLGTFKSGACFIGTSETHKCLVANNLLVAKSVNFN